MPDEIQPVTPAVETLAPAAEPTPAPADAVSPDIAAFRQGAAEATDSDEPAPVAAVAPAETTAEAPDATPAADPVTPPTSETQPDPQADPIEQEIKDRGITKEETAARFRELASRPSEEQVAPLREKASQFDAWQEVIAETRANNDQLSSALGYLQAINSGDPARMGAAFDAMSSELAWLGKKLGREVPGIVDLLEDYKDLSEAVRDGQVPRQVALETARLRAESAQRKANDDQRTQQQQTQKAWNDAATAALSGPIKQFSDRMAASDPLYAQKLDAIQPALDLIKANLHPNQWASAVAQAWAGLRLSAPALAPAAPVAKPPVTAMPIRPTGGAAVMKAEPKNDLEAFRMGVATLNR